ncbi:SPFH domain-containing protein, partial [Candidatus Uhrbacteria bacterium]|nr:SPFH domain-containing protein [Candidatus Uhrbacteria bacterium]
MDDYGYGHAQRLAESGDMGWGTVLAFAVLGIAALIFIFGSFFTVEQQTVAVVERLGKFIGTAQPGLNFKLPIIDSASRRVTLRVQQLEVPVTTKTHDNTFVTMKIVVQYQVIADRVFDAAYKLANPATQITSYVEDVVRAQVPKLALDAVFSEKDTVANTVKTELVGAMAEYGFLIVKTLVVDIAPDAKVQDAMNDINAAQRLRVAANERGEAEKTLAVKRAEAEAESKRLQGEGTAQQRLAI